MDELIKKYQTLRKEIIDLIIKKSALKKEGFTLAIDYHIIFGPYILKKQELFVETKRLKKLVSLYQNAISKKEEIDDGYFESIALSSISVHQDKLNRLRKIYEDAKRFDQAPDLTTSEINYIDDVFRSLLYQVYPYINPQIDDDALFNQVIDAYDDDDIDRLIELKGLVQVYGLDKEYNTIINYHELISMLEKRESSIKDEIEEIYSMYPFFEEENIYNDECREEKINELKKDLSLYDEQIKALNDFLAVILPKKLYS